MAGEEWEESWLLAGQGRAGVAEEWLRAAGIIPLRKVASSHSRNSDKRSMKHIASAST